MNDKFRLLTIGLACVFAGFPQISMAEELFKSSEFLTWDRKSQEFYIRTSVGMAGFITAKNNKNQHQCLESWYVSDINSANDHILETMARFPDYHPRGVIVAVLEKKCGALVF